MAELLRRGEVVTAVVRSLDGLPAAVESHENLSVVEASILDMSDAGMADLVQGCRAVVSCLGHNLTFRGVFGRPRRLVTDATRRLSTAISANAAQQPVKFVLMNTTANSNRDLDEPVSFAQKCVISLLGLLLPPHADNEQAAAYLRVTVGQGDPVIKWVAVRPDGLIDEAKVTGNKVHNSPTRSAIFNAGVSSRINVAHFMAELITDDSTWEMWRGKMPVIYNTGHD